MRVGDVGLGIGAIDALGRPKGSYPESFVSLSSLLAELQAYSE